MTKVRILYDGRLALTTAQAAVRYGIGVASMRKTIKRLVDQEQIAPLPEPLDDRTPLYSARDLDAAMKARPGRGAHLRAAPPEDLT